MAPGANASQISFSGGLTDMHPTLYEGTYIALVLG